MPGLPAGVKFDPTDQEILELLGAMVRSGIHKLHPLIDEFIPTLEGENGIIIITFLNFLLQIAYTILFGCSLA